VFAYQEICHRIQLDIHPYNNAMRPTINSGDQEPFVTITQKNIIKVFGGKKPQIFAWCASLFMKKRKKKRKCIRETIYLNKKG